MSVSSGTNLACLADERSWLRRILQLGCAAVAASPVPVRLQDLMEKQQMDPGLRKRCNLLKLVVFLDDAIKEPGKRGARGSQPESVIVVAICGSEYEELVDVIRVQQAEGAAQNKNCDGLCVTWLCKCALPSQAMHFVCSYISGESTGKQGYVSRISLNSAVSCDDDVVLFDSSMGSPFAARGQSRHGQDVQLLDAPCWKQSLAQGCSLLIATVGRPTMKDSLIFKDSITCSVIKVVYYARDDESDDESETEALHKSDFLSLRILGVMKDTQDPRLLQVFIVEDEGEFSSEEDLPEHTIEHQGLILSLVKRGLQTADVLDYIGGFEDASYGNHKAHPCTAITVKM